MRAVVHFISVHFSYFYIDGNILRTCDSTRRRTSSDENCFQVERSAEPTQSTAFCVCFLFSTFEFQFFDILTEHPQVVPRQNGWQLSQLIRTC